MRNTIAHFGVHGLATRGLLPKASLPLVYLGCMIPDVPWISQRIVNALIPRIDTYEV